MCWAGEFNEARDWRKGRMVGLESRPQLTRRRILTCRSYAARLMASSMIGQYLLEHRRRWPLQHSEGQDDTQPSQDPHGHDEGHDTQRVILQSLVAGLSDGAAAVEVLALVEVVLSCTAFLLGSMTVLMTGGGHSERSILSWNSTLGTQSRANHSVQSLGGTSGSGHLTHSAQVGPALDCNTNTIILKGQTQSRHEEGREGGRGGGGFSPLLVLGSWSPVFWSLVFWSLVSWSLVSWSLVSWSGSFDTAGPGGTLW
ncbi:hypothetical protein CRUP_019746 [Coryphaenoides rupestris]|nr:hypothetical protein CRUP_019746 [Coryphaenoides rupestris]